MAASMVALAVAWRTWGLYRSSRPYALSQRLQEVEESLEVTQASIRGLKSRIGMAELRARKREVEEEPPPEVDQGAAAGAEFRRKMNAAIAAGQVSALPRR